MCGEPSNRVVFASTSFPPSFDRAVEELLENEPADGEGALQARSSFELAQFPDDHVELIEPRSVMRRTKRNADESGHDTNTLLTHFASGGRGKVIKM
jgi:hypothetical protein